MQADPTQPLSSPNAAEATVPAGSENGASDSMRQSGYRRFADSAVRRHPIASYAPRFALWSMRALRRRLLEVGGTAVLWAALLIAGWVLLPDWRLEIIWLASGSALLLLGFLAAAYVKFLLQGLMARQGEVVAAQTAEIARLNSALEASQQDRDARFAAIMAQQADAQAGQQAAVAQLESRLAGLAGRQAEAEAGHRDAITRVESRQAGLDGAGETLARLQADLNALRGAVQRNSAQVEHAAGIAKSARENAQAAAQRLDQRIERVHAELTARDAELTNRQRQALDREVGRLREALEKAAQSDQLAAIAQRLDGLEDAARKAGEARGALETRLEPVEAGADQLRADLTALETEIREQIERIEARNETRGSNEARAIENLEEISAKIQARLAKLDEEANRAAAQVDEKIAAKMKPLSDRLGAQNGFINKSNAANAARMRTHQRYLTPADIEAIMTDWEPKLGLDLTPQQLSYAAHKICLMEDQAKGRLATSIQTAVLRLLLLQSLKRPGVEVLEIGTLFGLGAATLNRLAGDQIGRVSLTLLDPLDGYYGKGAKDPHTGVPINEETLRENFKLLGVPKKHYRIIKRFSNEEKAVSEAADRRYDYLLIDGDHSYDGVARDFEAYGPLVKPGGLVLFDDYDTPEWPAIADYVDNKARALEGWTWLGGGWRTGVLRKQAASDEDAETPEG